MKKLTAFHPLTLAFAWWDFEQCHSSEPSDWASSVAFDLASQYGSQALYPRHLLSPLCSLLSMLQDIKDNKCHNISSTCCVKAACNASPLDADHVIFCRENKLQSAVHIRSEHAVMSVSA